MKKYKKSQGTGQEEMKKTCGKKQHVKIDIRKGMSNLICGKFTVGRNYNSTHDSYIDYKIYKDMSSGNTSMGTFFLVMLMFLICCIFPPFVFVILLFADK